MFLLCIYYCVLRVAFTDSSLKWCCTWFKWKQIPKCSPWSQFILTPSCVVTILWSRLTWCVITARKQTAAWPQVFQSSQQSEFFGVWVPVQSQVVWVGPAFPELAFVCLQWCRGTQNSQTGWGWKRPLELTRYNPQFRALLNAEKLGAHFKLP